MQIPKTPAQQMISAFKLERNLVYKEFGRVCFANARAHAQEVTSTSKFALTPSAAAPR